MTLSVTIDLPDNLVRQLEETARSQQRSIADLLRDLVLQNLESLPRLPDDVETELAAMSSLSDEALWLLARSTLSAEEQDKLALLNQQAKMRALDSQEEVSLAALLSQYDRTMVRRAQAASYLQNRGHDLNDPLVLLYQ